MNGFLQLFAAVLFVLWDRGRMLRGAWRRGEWRNAGRQRSGSLSSSRPPAARWVFFFAVFGPWFEASTNGIRPTISAAEVQIQTMPRPLSLKNLPADVQAELQQRLVETGFSQFDSHVEWLAKRGISVSRSSIHRYATSQASTMLASANSVPADVVDAKLRCLEIASSIGTSKSTAELIGDAKVLLKWVYST